MNRTIKTGKFFRSFDLDRAHIDEEKRTVPISFSSEASIQRYFGEEILDHDKKSIRLNRIKSGGPLLLNHDTREQVGVIDSVRIDHQEKMGRAVVRFSKSQLGEEIFQDVIDGIRKLVSVGYQIHEVRLEKEKDGIPTYRAIDWEPLEISIVPIPADISVGVGREIDTKFTTIIRGVSEMEPTKNTPPQEPKAPVIDLDAVRSEAIKTEKARVAEIMALGEAHKCRDLAQKAAGEGSTVDAFRQVVLTQVLNAKPTNLSPNIGMNKKERQDYSILSAMRSVMQHKPIEGLEREASDAVAELTKRQPDGFYIPDDVMSHRDLSAGDATKGGFTVGTDLLSGSMIDLLRNKMLVARMGVTTLGGLVGNIAIPKTTGGAIAYWVPETGEINKTDQSFGQLGLTPHRLGADTAFSKELVMQSSIDVEAFVRADLMRVLALEKDRAALNGLGSAGEPIGIMNETGINTITFGGAATWADIVDFETQIATANADVNSMNFMTSPAVRGKWKTVEKFASTGMTLWEKGTERGVGEVNGYPAFATNQIPGNRVIFGNWSDLVLADWAGVDVVVDPYSLKKLAQIEVTINIWTDNGIRNAVSFCVSTDTGAA